MHVDLDGREHGVSAERKANSTQCGKEVEKLELGLRDFRGALIVIYSHSGDDQNHGSEGAEHSSNNYPPEMKKVMLL
jgi:hypothetical protein